MVFLLLIPSVAFTQSTNPAQDNIAEVLKNISEFITFSNKAITTLFISDTKRGGQFYKYTGSLPADNGMIFLDRLGTKWKRDVKDNAINPEWWGAAGDGITNDKPAFDAALAYYKRNTDKVAYMQLGQSSGGLVSYRFNDTIRIDFNADIRGGVNTLLLFGSNSAGLKLRSSETNVFIPTIYLTGIALKQVYCYETYDPREMGIEINCIAHLKDVSVQNFQGNGIVLWGNGGTSPPTNCDLSTLERVSVSESRNNGFLIYGADANIIDFKNCQAIACGAAGFLDNSFLGNNYQNCQTASCGSPELKFQRVLCKYRGLVYYALHNKDSRGRKNKLGQPDISPVDWALVPDQSWIAYRNILNYHVDSFYQAGGGFLLDADNAGGQNQFGTLTNCYSELDCPPSYWSYKCIAVGGDLTSIRSGLKLGGWFNSLDVNTSVRVSHPKTAQSTFQTSNAFAWQKRTNEIQGIVNVYDTTNNFLSWYDWLTYDADKTFHSYGGNFILPTQNTPAAFLGRRTLNKGAYFSPFMQEMYLNNRSAVGNQHKRIYLAESAPAPDASDMTGDIILNSITGSGNTILGWRKTANGATGLWEEISINKVKYNAQTGTTYTLNSTDMAQVITLKNAAAITLTVPAGLPAGFTCTIIQLGAGVVTIKPLGTTINNAEAFTRTGGQYTAVTVFMYSTDTFITQGKMQK